MVSGPKRLLLKVAPSTKQMGNEEGLEGHSCLA
jgi:hypothetical protein